MSTTMGTSTTGGARWAVVFFWTAAVFTVAGGLLYLGIDLRHQTHPDIGGFLGALGSIIPALALAIAFLSGVRGVQNGRLGLATALAFVAFVMDLVIGVSYIATLASFCSALPGCKRGGASLTVLATNQLLFSVALFFAAIALLVCLVTSLRRHFFPR